MLHLLLKRASDIVRVKENQGILLWYRRTSNDIDIGQIEPTIWKLIFPGQIELTRPQRWSIFQGDGMVNVFF